MKKFFASNIFFTKYDVNIQTIGESILHIPVVSNILPVAWAIGADVYLNRLDSSYLKSLADIKQKMRQNYPNFSFSSTLHVEKSVTNKFSNQDYGLFFSGGVDSTASFLRNKAKKPSLVLILGADIRLGNAQKKNLNKNACARFALKQGVNLFCIESNFREVINEEYLNVHFANDLYYYWYLDICAGIGLVGLIAPLTVAKSIGTVLYAADVLPQYEVILGEQYLQNTVTWGDITVELDGVEINRQKKIRDILKPYLLTTPSPPPLRVCFSQNHPFNCNNCEKCWRTIIGLVLENIDPNKCGFQINNSFFPSLKKRLLKDKHKILSMAVDIFLWDEIKESIPDQITHNLYNSKQFFEWLRTFDLPLKKRQTISNFTRSVRILYCYLPKRIRTLIRKLAPYF